MRQLIKALSVNMKLSIAVAVAFVLALFSLWQADLASDKDKQIKVTENVVSAHNGWECGYSNRPDCSVVFELTANMVLDVHRIRYGKDFMAIKVKLNSIYGWVILGEGVEFNANSNT